VAEEMAPYAEPHAKRGIFRGTLYPSLGVGFQTKLELETGSGRRDYAQADLDRAPEGEDRLRVL
jgi:hypothetical protein